MRLTLTAIVLAFSTWPATAFAQQVRELPANYDYPEPAWSPYIVGALIGVLTMLTLMFSKKPVGASSAYADTAGMIGRTVAPRHIGSLNYFQENKPAINWTFLFLLGTIAGAFIAAWTGGELTGTYLQPLWTERFGTDSFALRTVVALIGGAVMAYGARLAGGCTSGHGISGTLQLAVGSWIAVICFFVGGIAAAMFMYKL